MVAAAALAAAAAGEAAGAVAAAEAAVGPGVFAALVRLKSLSDVDRLKSEGRVLLDPACRRLTCGAVGADSLLNNCRSMV